MRRTNLSTFVVMSVLFLAMVSTTANGYCFFGEFTVNGNNSRENPLRISGIPAPCYVRITYSSGYFTNGGPMPGWGAYAGDCITVAGALGQIGCPFRACCGPAGCYYYDLIDLLLCLTNLPPFEFRLKQGDWIEVHVWDDPGAGCNTATRRCGSMSFTVDVAVPRATYYVDAGATGANDGSSWEDALTDLQDALSVAAAPPGVVEEIRVAQGIYTPTESFSSDREATFQLGNGLAIKGGYAGFGEPDPNVRNIDAYQTILSGDIGWVGYRGDNSYHVVTGSGTDETAVLDGFTITGGNGVTENRRGGGMYNVSGSPTVTNCTFSNNSVSDGFGGGMYNEGGSPTLSNCTFSGNSAEYGGGMYNWYSNATLTNCTISENSASSNGGGIYNRDSSSPTLTNCTFSGNSARHGGGMYNRNESSPILTNCTFRWSSAGEDGGGMRNYYSSPTLTNCTFIGNSAEYGGGMSNDNSSPTVTNCMFTDNTAAGGGGMDNYGGSPTLTNCTFSGNSAEYASGGMFNGESSPTITNCTFIRNSAKYGGGMHNENHSSPMLVNCTFSGNTAEWDGGGMCNVWNSTPALTNCILWSNSPQQIVAAYSSTPSVTYSDVEGGWPGEGNINADPCFVSLSYWADANDPNIVVEPDDPNAVWVEGDYHLLVGSPCINAGDPNFTTEPDQTDIDGHPRVIDGRIDMGADEVVIAVMKFTPQALNPDSKGNWVKAHFVLPEGFTIEDVNSNSPATVEPFGIESEYINVFVNENGFVEIEVAFGRAAFCGAATDYGPVEVTVIGLLTSGQYFYGTDTIKIVNKTFEYLAVLSSYWLEAGCGAPDWCGGLDLDHSSMVDFVDFAMFDGCCIEVIRQ